MSAEFRPKGLETWVYLLDESPIPVLAHTHKELKTLVGGVNEWALSEAADIIVKDPIMTVHLIREANRVFKNKVAGSLTDIHHCVSLLGEDRVFGLVKQFKAMKGDVNDTNEIAYQAAVVQSFHAAEQVKAWHQVKKQSAVDKHMLAAKLAGVPTWCLWYFANKEMAIIDTLQKQERISKVDAEKAVLGCTTQEIVNALAERWQFPAIILDALNDKKSPSPKFLAAVAREGYHSHEPRIPNKDERGEIVKTSSFIVSLANWLARESDIDWYSRQTRRVLAILAAYLEVDIHRARRIAQKAALNVSRQFEFPNVAMPGAKLLLPLQPNIRRRLNPAKLGEAVETLSKGLPLHKPPVNIHDEETKVFVEEESTQVQRKTAPMLDSDTTRPIKRMSGFVNEGKEKIFRNYISLLTTNHKAFSSENEVLRKTMEVLKEVTSLERIVLFLYDPKDQMLRGYSALGCEDAPKLKKMTIALKPPNFFTQLIKKPQGVWVNPDRKSDIAALVPGIFKQVSQANEFYSVSMFNLKKPVAMLYVDNGVDGSKALSEAEFKITKAIANAASKYMIQASKLARNS